MSTRPNNRVDAQARVLDHLAIDITRCLEHIQRELSAIDWHPADTMAGGTRGGEPASPTERVALVRYEFTGLREDIRDWIDGLENYIPSGRFLVDKALKMRGPSNELFDAGDYGKRCKHPTCTAWASDHRMPLTSSLNGDWCDEHWLSEACHVHGDHPHEQRRIDGVRCCQAAYRRHQRDTTKEVA